MIRLFFVYPSCHRSLHARFSLLHYLVLARGECGIWQSNVWVRHATLFLFNNSLYPLYFVVSMINASIPALHVGRAPV